MTKLTPTWQEEFELDVWPTDGSFSLGSNHHMKVIETFIIVQINEAYTRGRTKERQRILLDDLTAYDEGLNANWGGDREIQLDIARKKGRVDERARILAAINDFYDFHPRVLKREDVRSIIEGELQ